MNPTQRFQNAELTGAIIPLLIRMMVADGKIMKNEIQSLSEMIEGSPSNFPRQGLGISLSEILTKVLKKTDEEVISESLSILKQEEREEALLLLFGMAGIDGSFHKKEKDFISKVQLAFGYDKSKIDGVLDLI